MPQQKQQNQTQNLYIEKCKDSGLLEGKLHLCEINILGFSIKVREHHPVPFDHNIQMIRIGSHTSIYNCIQFLFDKKESWTKDSKKTDKLLHFLACCIQ